MNAKGPGHWYEMACRYDRAGEELKAEPCYRMVYRLCWRKLPAKERPGFFVGYGSTLRNNGKLALSARVLDEGVRRFPGYPALKVFAALTAFSRKDYRKAARLLFLSSVDMPEKAFDGYERAIAYYVSHLK